MKKLFVFLVVTVLVFSTVAAKPAPGPTPTPTPTPTPSTSVTIPVIVFHSISDNGDHYSTKVSVFKDEMAYLNSNGYTTLSAQEYYSIMTGQATAPAKPILLTFDDCYADFYTTAYPVLKQYNMKAIEFAVVNWMNTANHLTNAQLATLAADPNIDVQNHTVTHGHLSQMSVSEITSEISGCNNMITTVTNEVPWVVAYPYGDYNADTLTVEKSLGIKMAFVVGGGNTVSGSDMFTLGRTITTSSDTLTTFQRKLP